MIKREIELIVKKKFPNRQSKVTLQHASRDIDIWICCDLCVHHQRKERHCRKSGYLLVLERPDYVVFLLLQSQRRYVCIFCLFFCISYIGIRHLCPGLVELLYLVGLRNRNIYC